MHSEGADRRHFGQTALYRLPLVAAVGQPKQPGVHHPASSGFTSEAEVNIGGVIVFAVARHGIARLCDVGGMSPSMGSPSARLGRLSQSLAIHARFGKAFAERRVKRVTGIR